ncbi:hypothetical protein A2721_01855 [Candidatus Gottesmanbacteria bacterium RIFCSPHIGHO2_01_FULL_47_48]|uniref:Septum formation initiator n=1 Tax=Candidatus Gottesmanbacteria bacterium RIFCSPHIGHO2_01_FULL_47_48 TaxID=1798381 RepID=A0A1F6A1G4_9BACT|nr:MAG: hypothetical protein A2721_01855 [Candidatus Gottesmanbacteria bacterium RIFCSPHIGHO2_01_FULL_47_48]
MKRDRLARVVIIGLCLYFIVTTVSGTVELWRSGEKVTRREEELAKLEKEKGELVRKDKEAGTKDYLERIAYDKLGLARPGEEVIIVPEDVLASPSGEVAVREEENWKKWANLIFN